MIFLNLFLVANKKRFIEVMDSNNINKNRDETEKWLFNHPELLVRGLKFISSELNIPY